MITAILLAAGLSSRFGSPKSLAVLDGERIIVRLQKILLASPVAEIIIVLGAAAEKIQQSLLKHINIKVVYNKDYKLGQTVSVQVGVKSAHPQTEGILLLPVDYPWVQTGTMTDLIRVFKDRKPDVLIPVFKGRKGHPPIFSAHLKEELENLNADEGLIQVARRHASGIVCWPVVDPGVVLTFNTVEEFVVAQKTFQIKKPHNN